MRVNVKNTMVFLNKRIIGQKIENQTSLNIEKKYVMPHLKVKFSLFTLN